MIIRGNSMRTGRLPLRTVQLAIDSCSTKKLRRLEDMIRECAPASEPGYRADATLVAAKPQSVR